MSLRGTPSLGVDKTFNLEELHATLTIFKNLAIIRWDNNEHPIFLGTLILHGNSDYITHHGCFSHLSATLRGMRSQPIFGTDDDIAMKQAIPTLHIMRMMSALEQC